MAGNGDRPPVGRGRGALFLNRLNQRSAPSSQASGPSQSGSPSQASGPSQASDPLQTSGQSQENLPTDHGTGMGRALLFSRGSLGSAPRASLSSHGDFHSDSGIVPTQSATASRVRPSLFRGRGGLIAARFQTPLRHSPATLPPQPTPEPAHFEKEFERVRIGDTLLHAPSAQQQQQQQQQPESESHQQVSIPSRALSRTQRSPPPIEPVIRRGESGKKQPASANYIKFELEPGRGVYEYEVRYVPDVDSLDMRQRYLNQHRDVIGHAKTFDGTVLYLPIQLPQEVTELRSRMPDDTPVTIRVIYKRQKPITECMHVYNVLFKRIMNTLKLVRFGKHSFDPTGKHAIPQHKLEVWPGFITAIAEYEGGIQLCCDVSHRVLRTQTCLDLMNDIAGRSRQRGATRDCREDMKKLLIGTSVLTRYNNRMYKVDDIDFSKNPLSTFTAGDKEIRFIDYFCNQYNIQIQNERQPLLMTKMKRRSRSEENVDILICLIPELCYITGLTDDIRTDFRAMKDITAITAVGPAQRHRALMTFIQSIKENDDARQLLSTWGLRIPNATVELIARTFDSETMIFGGGKTFKYQEDASWNKALSRYAVITSVDIIDWVVICHRRDSRTATDFIESMSQVSPGLGINLRRPMVVQLDNDNTDTYLRAIKANKDQGPPQIFVIIFPTSRDDRYSAVKRLLCVDLVLPSQVINVKTISRRDKLKPIVEKIALQINCKLGGTLWGVTIPLKSLMVCGVDVYHDASGGRSVVGFVASTDKDCTKWYSKVSIQSKGQELSEALIPIFSACLQQWKYINGEYPRQIIIYRDGVGDGQLDMVNKIEIAQLKTCFKLADPNYAPKFSYIIVQKRINTRLYLQDRNSFRNPTPGTIIDSFITRRNYYDFFLVSQTVRQGTVAPTHYIVLEDNSELPVDRMQRMAYKMCHLYYNWPGTVRVPAPCQYAHKLAYLIGQNVRANPSEEMCDKLFFL